MPRKVNVEQETVKDENTTTAAAKEADAKEQIGVEVAGSYGIDGKISIPVLNENLGHIEGIKGAQAIAGSIWLLLHNASKEKVKKYIETKYYELNFKLDDIRKQYSFDVTCQGSVPQSIESFLEYNYNRNNWTYTGNLLVDVL